MQSERNHRRRLFAYTALTLAVMLLIFLLSAQDAERSTDLSEGLLSSRLGALLERLLPGLTGQGFSYDLRKYAHVFEYFCLGVSGSLLFRELYWKRPGARAEAFASSVGLSFLYACSDELHQLFVPGRTGRFSDVLVDAAGFVPAALALLALKKQRPRLDKEKESG